MMKFAITFFTLFFFIACSNPAPKDELSHMRKSKAIEATLENLDQIHYDDSHSEIDRDILKLNYAKDFHQEVSTLLEGMKKYPNILPNKKPIPEDKRADYNRILQLLEGNLIHVKHVIENKRANLVLSAIQNTKKTCTSCHLLFRGAQ